MRNLLTALFVTCAALVPATVQAAPASQISRSIKKYGDFKPGYQFTLRVTDRDVVKLGGSLPGEIPNFRKGDKIKFTIGDKGQLKGPDGLKIDFDDSSKKRNDYVKIGSNPLKLTSVGYISKDSNRKPVKGKITFTITSFDHFLPMKYLVTYTLKK